MMSSGMSAFVAAAAVLNTIAAVALLVWMRKRRGEAAQTSDTTGHTWDGDLREYNNPLPRWWLWLFVLSVIFAIVYAVLYPALGNARGSLGWSQVEQWEQSQAEQEKTAQRVLAVYANRSSEELAHDPAALAIGRNLFANNCAACHGSDGRGGSGFPNLTDQDWLWGGSPELVEASISGGRMGVMAPWQEVFGEQGVEQLGGRRRRHHHLDRVTGQQEPEHGPRGRRGLADAVARANANLALAKGDLLQHPDLPLVGFHPQHFLNKRHRVVAVQLEKLDKRIIRHLIRRPFRWRG